jgi:hypothetical protein
MALGDESPEILDRQAGVRKRLSDANPLDVDRAEARISLPCPDDAELGQPLHLIGAHARARCKLRVRQSHGGRGLFG